MGAVAKDVAISAKLATMGAMSCLKTPHPAWIWLSVVAVLLGLAAWVVLGRDAPSTQDPRRASADLRASAAPPRAEPASAVARGASPAFNSGTAGGAAGLGLGGGAASPSRAGGYALPGPGSQADDPDAAPADDAASLLAAAQRELAARHFAAARRSALGCLKAEPNNAACAKARVHSYTQQYPLSETSEIVRWCLSAFASDLNCLRQLRLFHQSKGEDMDASGISAEIRARFPDANLELPSAPDDGE